MVDEELPPLPLNVERLVRVLDDHGVKYVLTGGLALILYDVTDRQTYDLDVVPEGSRDNLIRLGTALRRLKAQVISHWDPESEELHVEDSEFAPAIFTGNPFLHLLTPAGRIDVLLTPDGIPEGYSKLAGSTGQASIEGVFVALASLDDLFSFI